MRFPPVGEYFLLGRTLKSHGAGGRLRLLVPEKLRSYVRPGEFIFIDIDGSKVPFRIAEVEDDRHFIVALDGITGKEQSDALSGKEIGIPIHQVKQRHLAVQESLPSQWEGYTLCNTVTGLTYHILRTEEYPQQLMAVVAHVDREVLVPLHDQLISDIDPEARVISMAIPEGLLEL